MNVFKAIKKNKFFPYLAPLFAIGFIVALHLSMTLYYRKNASLNADEGYYALAARSVMEGKIPYRDFAYTQMPLLPYFHGAVMTMTGFGLMQQRTLNVIWSLFGVLVIALAIRQRSGTWAPGVLAVFAASSSPHWSVMQTIGKTYGAAGMFMAICTAAALVRFPFRPRAIVFTLAATLAVGCRLTCLPVAGFLGIAMLLEARRPRDRILIFALPTLVISLTFLPFILAAPRAFLFDVVKYHLASVFDRQSLAGWLDWWEIAPGAVLLFVAGLATSGQIIKKRDWPYIPLLLAGLAGILLPMASKSAYGEYIVPTTTVATAIGILACVEHGGYHQSAALKFLWVLPALVLLQPLPKESQDHLTSVNETALFIKEKAKPGPMLTPLPIVAVESGRSVVPGTEMGIFAAMGPDVRSGILAPKYKYTTLRELTDLVSAKEPAVIVLQKGNSPWNFAWQVPTLRRQPKSLHNKFLEAVKEHYQSAAVFGHFFEVFLPK